MTTRAFTIPVAATPPAWPARPKRNLSWSPLQRVQLGAMVLMTAVLLGTLGFHWLGEYGWIEALWMVVITISTVGYGEHADSGSMVQLLTIGVILVGMSSAVYTFTGAFQLVLEGELERTFGAKRMSRQIEQLKNHVIICGMGRSGRNLAADLRHRGQPFVMVENNETRVEEAVDCEYAIIVGDATEEAVLQRAGIQRARAIVSALPSDADNVFITLTAKELNPDVMIVASAERESTAKKLRQAGARKIVMPSRVGALQMSRMILNPSAADLMELVAESSYLDLQLDEIEIASVPGLIGMSVSDTEAHRRHKLLVVAVRQDDGEMVFNPDADYSFQSQDIAIVMGHQEHIESFRSHFLRARKHATHLVNGKALAAGINSPSIDS